MGKKREIDHTSLDRFMKGILFALDVLFWSTAVIYAEVSFLCQNIGVIIEFVS